MGFKITTKDAKCPRCGANDATLTVPDILCMGYHDENGTPTLEHELYFKCNGCSFEWKERYAVSPVCQELI